MTMSRLVDTLSDMERAEDLFLAYGVAVNPQVLAIHRLHILRRFGRTLAARDAARVGGQSDEDGERLALAEALAEAHAYFAAGGTAEIVPSRHGGTPLVQIRRAPGGSRS
jgi:hypothetical protein